MNTRVKICCIGSIQEAWLAIHYGASAIGLVSYMPSGPGVIPDSLIGTIAAEIPPGIGTFLLTSRTDPDDIIAQHQKSNANTLQLCDAVSTKTHRTLRASLPGIAIVQGIHVRNWDALDEAKDIAPFVSALLLDSGNPALAQKELGGTGRTHNWEISKAICETVKVPIFLAGGLTAENVREAITLVHPFAVDLCSGVRTDGKLDESKLASFMQHVASTHSVR